jgi:CubicO group peptidase (beta-lactamase class C family)
VVELEGLVERVGNLHTGLLALAILAATPAASVAQEVWPDPDWLSAAPQDHGLDPHKLGELVRLIRGGQEFPDLHSLLIVRHGYLVLEEYFGDHDADRLHMLQSVTKSITSAAVGLAIDGGHIASVNERIAEFFPERHDQFVRDRRWGALRVEDILTMRSGTDYREGFEDSPHNQLNRLRRGWDRFYLDRPMVREPGTQFQYDSGGVILLSSMIQRRTGSHADAFADQRLFAPLGITRTRWIRNLEGHPHTGGGLFLSSRDMAKFGLLYLREGMWMDQQVIPRSWVRSSTRTHVVLENRGHTMGYGYLWWILQPDPNGTTDESIYAAMGFRAQYIFVVPEHDMVVVITGGTTSRGDQIQPVLFLYSHILPAVTR